MLNMYWTLPIILLLIPLWFLYDLVQPVDRKWHRLNAIRLPPGPSGWPIVGNLLQFWKAKDSGSMISYLRSLGGYGDMTTLHMGSQLWVLINTDHVAQDLIGKRSSITSERPHMPISSGLVSNNKRVVIQQKDTWYTARRLMRQLLTGPSLRSFEEWQDLESSQLMLSYLDEPERWHLHHFRYGTSYLFGVMSGDRLPDLTDSDLAEYRRVPMEFLGSLTTSAVDFYPMLERLPHKLQFWRSQWEAVGRSHRRVFKKWWDMVRTTAEQSTAKSAWVRDSVLDTDTIYKFEEEQAMYLTNSVITAGADNTRMTMNVFMMASICYPKAYQLCRQELDEVCGVDKLRLPCLVDVHSTPYVCAFIKEIMRWRPIVPLIPPHQLTEDLQYKEYVFPKGTNFVVNTIATCAEFDEADDFQPERWLDGNETNLTRGFWGFGGGRRVCIGYKSEQPALYLAISRLIYCFDIESNGPVDSKRLNHASFAEPFPLSVRPRSPKHADLVRVEAAARGLASTSS